MAWLQLARPVDRRVVAGVCAALAERWMIDVHLLRIAFAVLAAASGIGVALYLVLWFLSPSGAETGTGWDRIRGNIDELRDLRLRSAASLTAAWRRTERLASPWPRSRRWIGLGLLVLGVWLALASVGLFDWLGVGVSLGLVLALVGLGVIRGLGAPRGDDRQVQP